MRPFRLLYIRNIFAEFSVIQISHLRYNPDTVLLAQPCSLRIQPISQFESISLKSKWSNSSQLTKLESRLVPGSVNHITVCVCAIAPPQVALHIVSIKNATAA